MKRKIFLAVISIFFIFSVSAFAENNKNHNSTSKLVAKYIKENLKYPETYFGNKVECCVWVEISITNEGKFKVTGYNGSDNRLKTTIISEIEKLTNHTNMFNKYSGTKSIIKIMFRLK